MVLLVMAQECEYPQLSIRVPVQVPPPQAAMQPRQAPDPLSAHPAPEVPFGSVQVVFKLYKTGVISLCLDRSKILICRYRPKIVNGVPLTYGVGSQPIPA